MGERQRESSSTKEGGPATRQPNEEHHNARGDRAAPRMQLCRPAAHLRRSSPETRSSLSRPAVASLSLLEAASLSQLEEVLLDVASLSRLAAALLSLEEALSSFLLDREGAPSLFISVFFVKKQRERAS